MAIILWSTILLAAALTLTIGNKYILRGFEYPLTLLFLQNSTAACVLFLGAKLRAKTAAFSKKQFVIIFIAALVSTVQLGASLIAMPNVSIATLTVFSNARPLAQCVLEFFILRESFARREYAALGLIALSSVFYWSGDQSSTAEGTMWLAVNAIASVSLALFKVSVVERKRERGKGKEAHHSTPLTPPHIRLLLFLLYAFRYSYIHNTQQHTASLLLGDETK